MFQKQSSTAISFLQSVLVFCKSVWSLSQENYFLQKAPIFRIYTSKMIHVHEISNKAWSLEDYALGSKGKSLKITS